jgi:hypothetical protein
MRRCLVGGLVVGVCAALLSTSAGLARQQNCGGEERWAVKVAADAGAAQFDVANPIVTLLHDLIALPRPTLPTDDTTRLQAERAVRVVDGRLVRFKLESGRTGDQDYHLVVTDDTLLFSPGGSRTRPVPHSFVAEIVNPDCVVGRDGQVTAPSRFATELQTVYDAFHAAVHEHLRRMEPGRRHSGADNGRDVL